MKLEKFAEHKKAIDEVRQLAKAAKSISCDALRRIEEIELVVNEPS